MSSLGKGISTAVLSSLLQSRGVRVLIKKLDPYLNVDAGTLGPSEHGEAFVTIQGYETDLDLGHYERFTGNEDNQWYSAGTIYQKILRKERQGDYDGQTVQIIPHVTEEIKKAILDNPSGAQVIVCEIGGTVGDIEGLAFLEAARQVRYDVGAARCLFVHLSCALYLPTVGQVKTKPVQHSVAALQRFGIQPDLILCRTQVPLPLEARKKISLFCNLPLERVIEARDVETIYQAPIAYHEAGLDTEVLKYFEGVLFPTVEDGDEEEDLSLQTFPKKDLTLKRDGQASSPEAGDLVLQGRPSLRMWRRIVHLVKNPEYRTRIGLVGKYVSCSDAYQSVYEALRHGGVACHAQVDIVPVDSEGLEGLPEEEIHHVLGTLDGIIVPGGFGTRGAQGMIRAIHFGRTHHKPVFGVCFGMQMMVIESVRSLAGLEEANSSEFGYTPHPVVSLVSQWMEGDDLRVYESHKGLGGTMRLGSQPCLFKEGSRIADIYGCHLVQERHRHRYEINGNYAWALEKAHMDVGGTSPTSPLIETVERKDHPWFIGVQFHPELASRPFDCHPLYADFVRACLACGA